MELIYGRANGSDCRFSLFVEAALYGRNFSFGILQNVVLDTEKQLTLLCLYECSLFYSFLLVTLSCPGSYT